MKLLLPLTPLAWTATSRVSGLGNKKVQSIQKSRRNGLTHHKECFTERATANFYQTDFNPFVREERKAHDLALLEVLVKMWGPAN